MRTRRAAHLAGGLALLWTGEAAAHAFDAGADAYNQVVEGIAVVLTYPGLLLPLLALGVFVSLWRMEGLPLVWPAFLLGQVAGVILGAFTGPWVGGAAMAVGVVVAALAALRPRANAVAAQGIAAMAGLAVMAAAFEGHGLFELTVWIHIGLFLGTNMVLAVAAGLARLSLERVTAAWMGIGWRIVASWIAAVLVLVLAFALRGPLA